MIPLAKGERVRVLSATMMLMIALGPAASAQEVWASFPYKGYGTESCATWTAERRDGNGREGDEWVFGLLAGVALAGARNPIAKTHAKTVSAWISRYCLEKPTDSVMEAAEAFLIADASHHAR